MNVVIQNIILSNISMFCLGNAKERDKTRVDDIII